MTLKKAPLIFLILSFLTIQCASEGEMETTAPVAEDTTTIVETPPAATVDNSIAYGIDISHFQGEVAGMLNASDSIDFVICKATQGVTYVDPEFSYNWEHLLSEGYIRGAYHFYSTADDPVDQANFFTSTVDLSAGTNLPLVLDIEGGSIVGDDPTTEKMQADVLSFLQTVEANTKMKPIIYSGSSFAKEWLNIADIAEYPLWLADYAEQPDVPSAWTDYTIWQSTSSYSLDNETTDYDQFNGSMTDLEEFIKASAVAPE